MYQIKGVEKIKTRFMFNNFFFLENRAVYDIVSKNIVQTDRQTDRQTTDDNIKRHMRTACWILKATNMDSKM
jgi:hypothetical protein